MSATLSFLGSAGVGSPVYVSSANPLPVTGISVTIAGVTIADGADVAEGAKANSAVIDPTASASVVSLLKGQIAMVRGGYETVAASQTAQVLGATGATGDYLSGLLVIPATVDAGAVTLLDGATSIPVFAGGTGSVSTLIPFFIPIGCNSVSGAWKVTTGAAVSVIGVGKFT